MLCSKKLGVVGSKQFA